MYMMYQIRLLNPTLCVFFFLLKNLESLNLSFLKMDFGGGGVDSIVHERYIFT